MTEPCIPSTMTCRPGCGACCVAPSISGPVPGMPQGKPAGARCAQLLPDLTCAIYGSPERPLACASFPAMAEHCGANRDEALLLLEELERLTRPNPGREGRL
jgi:Fe-S-cluster containining protein